jgi:hypothetical protein
MHWGCRPRPLLQDWFREDGLCGQNLNMVFDNYHNNSKHTILFLIQSQKIVTNHLAETWAKWAADSNYKLFKDAYLIEWGACSKLLTWLKRVHAQSCLLDWTRRVLKVAYFIEKGACSKLLTWLNRAHAQSCLLDWKGRMLKVAYLIEKGAFDF